MALSKTKWLVRRSGQRGFSLAEMLVVIAIILVISAVAVPNIMRAVRNLRLRDSASTVAGILQEGRMRAVRDNRWYRLTSDTPAGGTSLRVFADTARTGAYVPGAPVALLAPNVQWVGNPGANPPGVVINPLPSPLPAFNGRGLPCVTNPPNAAWPAPCSNTVAGGAPVAFAYFLGDPGNPNAFAAVSVSSAGRIKTWSWDGVQWQAR